MLEKQNLGERVLEKLDIYFFACIQIFTTDRRKQVENEEVFKF